MEGNVNGKGRNSLRIYFWVRVINEVAEEMQQQYMYHHRVSGAFVRALTNCY